MRRGRRKADGRPGPQSPSTGAAARSAGPVDAGRAPGRPWARGEQGMRGQRAVPMRNSSLPVLVRPRKGGRCLFLTSAATGLHETACYTKLFMASSFWPICQAFAQQYFLQRSILCGGAATARRRSGRQDDDRRRATMMEGRGRLVPRVGFEPTAYRLRSGCSTTELSGLALAFGRVPIEQKLGPSKSYPTGCAGWKSARKSVRAGRNSGLARRCANRPFRQADQGVIPPAAVRSKSRLQPLCFRLQCRRVVQERRRAAFIGGIDQTPRCARLDGC